MGDTIQKIKNIVKKALNWGKLRMPALKRRHFNAFPAVHLKKMDTLDMVIKFSGELLAVGLTVIVGLFTVGFFKLGGTASADNSYAFMFLSNHTKLDNKYYAHETSIKTVVASGGGFIAQAHADDFLGATTPNPINPAANTTDSIIDNNSLSQPSPDSVKALVAKQIKVYTTVAGDSLSSVAAQNGISIKTLAEANNLASGTVLKPGWQLIILPVDGVLITADSNDTLPDIAHQYNTEKYNTNSKVREDAANALLQTIISYNGLDGAEDINPGDLIIVPGGEIVQPPAPKPTPKPKPKSSGPDNSLNEITSLGDGYDGINHIFPKGYCTYYVATKMKITFGGNAKNWLPNAKASGYVTGAEAASHAAVVMTGPTGAMRKYGHVAYVESVNDDGTITLSEMNYEHFNKVDERTISIHDSSIRGYIYP